VLQDSKVDVKLFHTPPPKKIPYFKYIEYFGRGGRKWLVTIILTKQLKKKKKKLRGLSPQANYTEWATAVVGEVSASFTDRGVSRSQRGESPMVVISVF
jgi:hypothetical protein